MSSTIDDIYRRMDDDIEQPADIDLNKSEIRKFFAGKKILLSGATGYVGRVFIEKILRDCPELGRLYVLVREKKSIKPEDKVKRYFQHVIFDKLRTKNPNFPDKVTTITGDLQQDKLGLSPKDHQIITSNVDVIVHSGATTRFDEKLSVVLKINVLGTKHMLDLAMDCKKIQVFVHVSTGYSHCYRKPDIEETFYESPIGIDKVYEIIETDEQNNLTEEKLKKLLGKWPNNYVFGKAIAEGLVENYGDKAKFATAVYRPTIIIAARKEPLPGWVNANNALTLSLLGMGLGIMHAIHHDNDKIVDMIPVDLTVNALIAVIYDVSRQWKHKKKPMVYNFGSRTTNPVKMNDMSKWFLNEVPKIGSTKSLWHPFVFDTKTLWWFRIMHVFLHFIPALLVDFGMICLGKKPKAVRLFFFMTKNLKVIDYFGNGDWHIKTEKTLGIYDRLNEADQAIFDFDVRKLDWELMTVVYTRGARLYILKESLENIEQTKKRFQRMRILHYAVTSILLLLIGYSVMKFISYVCII